MDEPNWPQEIASTPVVHFNLLEFNVSTPIPTMTNQHRIQINKIAIRIGARNENSRAALPHTPVHRQISRMNNNEMSFIDSFHKIHIHT